MKESQSLTNNLLMEVEVLSNRLRNIKQSYKSTENKALKGRLFSENRNLFKRVKEIYKVAELLNKNNACSRCSAFPKCLILRSCKVHSFTASKPIFSSIFTLL